MVSVNFFADSPTPPIPALPRGCLLPVPCTIDWACCLPVTPTTSPAQEAKGLQPAGLPCGGASPDFPHGSCPAMALQTHSTLTPNLHTQPRAGLSATPCSPVELSLQKGEEGGLGPSRQLEVELQAHTAFFRKAATANNPVLWGPPVHVCGMRTGSLLAGLSLYSVAGSPLT